MVASCTTCSFHLRPYTVKTEACCAHTNSVHNTLQFLQGCLEMHCRMEEHNYSAWHYRNVFGLEMPCFERQLCLTLLGHPRVDIQESEGFFYHTHSVKATPISLTPYEAHIARVKSDATAELV